MDNASAVAPPLMVPHFATRDEVPVLRRTVERLIATQTDLGKRNPLRWEAALVACFPFIDEGSRNVALAVRARALQTVRPLVADPARLCHEFTLLAADFPGGHATLHADNKKFDAASNSWIPNHTPQRVASALLYLTGHGSDFSGGAIAFPQFAKKVLPAPGLLVAFPSDERYQHGVTPITAGCRLSIALWFTDDAQREERIHAR